MNLLVVIISFFLMEGVTWLAHKYVMHGFLWVLHKDHHQPVHKGDWEGNDLFFVLFAVPTIALMKVGANRGFNFLFFIGVGIFLYGIAYFFVHDIFIHQRIPLLRHTQNPYLLAIRRAHKQHHKHVEKGQGECFGFLWVPLKYFRMYFMKKS